MEIFFELAQRYTNDKRLVSDLWTEIEKNYSAEGRYYHTLGHIENMFAQLLAAAPFLENRDAVFFAVFYHDIIYSPINKDNEEQSAALAASRMDQLPVPAATSTACIQHILATKTHTSDNNNDTNYFTDADLSVLGASPAAYKVYTENIRREYAVYPDEIYVQGRKRVLEHFLQMPQIFKTPLFKERLEAFARTNLQEELALISGSGSQLF